MTALKRGSVALPSFEDIRRQHRADTGQHRCRRSISYASLTLSSRPSYLSVCQAPSSELKMPNRPLPFFHFNAIAAPTRVSQLSLPFLSAVIVPQSKGQVKQEAHSDMFRVGGRLAKQTRRQGAGSAD